MQYSQLKFIRFNDDEVETWKMIIANSGGSITPYHLHLAQLSHLQRCGQPPNWLDIPIYFANFPTNYCLPILTYIPRMEVMHAS